ncbi:MAG: TIGR03936 family radical SAM-associated protein, partial [Kofleriaceae bacterium]
VGLEDGFLLAEYRKALKGRASPPCGKVAGMLIHHTNLAEAEPDRRKLVCYDCGVACDLSKMREDRLVALRVLGAVEPVGHAAAAQLTDDAPMLDISERGGGSPAESEARTVRKKLARQETERAERVRVAGHVGVGAPYTTYRIRFAKVGRAAFLGHLDLGRLLARSFRRADLTMAMSRGYAPKPRIVFGPALGLGIPSLGELIDVDLEHVVRGKHTWEIADGDTRIELPADEVFERLASVCPPGVELQRCEIVRLGGHPLVLAHACKTDVGLGKLVTSVDVLVKPAPDGMVYDAARLQRIAAAFLAKPSVPVVRKDKSAEGRTRSSAEGDAKSIDKTIDVRAFIDELEVIDGDAATKLCGALDWADGPLIRARVGVVDGSAKPSEVARALGIWGAEDPRAEHALVARLGVVSATPVRLQPTTASASDLSLT